MFISIMFCCVINSPVRFIQLKTGEEIILQGDVEWSEELILVRDERGEFYCFHRDQVMFIQNRQQAPLQILDQKPKKPDVFFIRTKPKKENITITNELLEGYSKAHPYVSNQQVSSNKKAVDSTAEHDMLVQKKENLAAQKKAKPILAKLEKIQKKIDALKNVLIHTIDADQKAELLIEFDQLRVEKQKIKEDLKKIQKESRKRGAKARFQIPAD